MSKPNLGPSHALAIQLSTSKTNTQNLMTRNVLQNATISQGGLTVNGGGSITIAAPGTLNLQGGVLSVALSIMAGTTVTAGTSVSAPVIAASTDIQAPDAYISNAPTNVFTGARVAGWWLDANGQAGTATSSRRFKDNEVLAVVDPRKILSINMKVWNYKAELAKRDDPESPGYVGPDYHVALNFSPIAEDLHEAGLWMAVVYERNREDGTLKLDEHGEPIPLAIHDSLWGYLVHMVTQWLSGRLDSVEARLDAAGL